jgi:hypothetical protein
VPPDHGSRDAPAARNRLPDAGKQSWQILRNLRGEHSCTQRVARGRLLAMGSSRTAVRGTRTKIAAVLATLIRVVGGVIVLILVAHVVLSLGNANPANGIIMFLTYWADRLQLGFRGLFNPVDPRTRLVVDYGIPAVFWLVVTWVLVRLVRRLG